MKKSFARILGLPSESEQDAAGHPSPATEKAEVCHVPLDSITMNPYQPRKTFNRVALEELSQSIKEHGIIQPILVRRKDDRYELIAGERRLRAAKLAGLTHVPVIVRAFSDQEMAELAIIENLQREDLHFLEEAEGYQQLLHNFGMTQEELAKRVGKSQSTIANKLRILKLPEPVRKFLAQEMITERHARALLRLEDEALQMQVLQTVCQRDLTVRQTEELVEKLLEEIAKDTSPASRQKIIKVIKDARILVNTIYSVVNDMKKTGLDIKVNESSSDDSIILQIQIPKRR